MTDKQSWITHLIFAIYGEQISNGEITITPMSDIKKADEWGITVKGCNQDLNNDVLRVANILAQEYNRSFVDAVNAERGEAVYQIANISGGYSEVSKFQYETTRAMFKRILYTAPQPPVAPNNLLQPLVDRWMQVCFGDLIAKDKVERNHRFLEEALELVQSLDCTKEEALQLVDYVYNRPKGEPSQEVGGVLITLSALCTPNGVDMELAGRTEYNRIIQPAVIEKIRAKQASKPKNSPLPQTVAPNQSDFDEWMKNKYTKVLIDSIKNDCVPKNDQSAYIKRLEDALMYIKKGSDREIQDLVSSVLASKGEQ